MNTNKLFSILAAAIACVSISNRAVCDTFGSGANSFDIEFVTIGNPNNVVDHSGQPNPAGSVPYAYRMGKYEISRDMVIKASSAGGLGITLDDISIGGNLPNRPATGVTWTEAARFVNWLNTSSGSPPAYKFTTPPGGTGQIEYNQQWTPSDPGYDPNNLYRNSLARYFLPSVHEWYKAAYYDPNSGVYYDYATGSNTAPTPVASGTAAGTAVYGQSFDAGPADITLAGGLSPYGTMGQTGNVWEWEETDFDLVNGPTNPPSNRGARGGQWISNSLGVNSSSRMNVLATNGLSFRVASTFVPEPTTAALLALAAFACGCLRRHRS